MSSRAYTVRARWDEVSKTWWTDGEDIPGLCCQADSFEELIEAVLALAPELLRDNGVELPGQAREFSPDSPAAGRDYTVNTVCARSARTEPTVLTGVTTDAVIEETLGPVCVPLRRGQGSPREPRPLKQDHSTAPGVCPRAEKD